MLVNIWELIQQGGETRCATGAGCRPRPGERCGGLFDLGQAKLRIPETKDTLSAVGMNVSEASQAAFFLWDLPPPFFIFHRDMGRMTKIILVKGMCDMWQWAGERA